MSSAKKKILLAGGSGYIGRSLAEYLSSDFHVISTGGSQKPGYLQLDLNRSGTYPNILPEGPYDVIFILASSMRGLGDFDRKPEDLELDMTGLPDFLNFIRDNHLSERIIYTSSMTVFGLDHHGAVNEATKPDPIHTYGYSKVQGEMIFRKFCSDQSVKGMILRIPGIYGGDRTNGFIYNTIRKMKNNGMVELDLSKPGYWETMNIRDLCTAVRDLLRNYDWLAGCELFHIGYGIPAGMESYAKQIKAILRSGSEIRISGNAHTGLYLDNSKVRRYISIQNDYLSSLKEYIPTVK